MSQRNLVDRALYGLVLPGSHCGAEHVLQKPRVVLRETKLTHWCSDEAHREGQPAAGPQQGTIRAPPGHHQGTSRAPQASDRQSLPLCLSENTCHLSQTRNTPAKGILENVAQSTTSPNCHTMVDAFPDLPQTDFRFRDYDGVRDSLLGRNSILGVLVCLCPTKSSLYNVPSLGWLCHTYVWRRTMHVSSSHLQTECFTF